MGGYAIEAYVLQEMKPAFIFGSRVNKTFAAGRTRFYESQLCEERYVRLEFPGQPQMSANLGVEPR